VLGALTIATDNRLASDPATTKAINRASNPWFIALCFGALAASLQLSAYLYASGVPYSSISLALAAVTAASWVLLDGTKQGLGLMALCGLGAPVAEMLLLEGTTAAGELSEAGMGIQAHTETGFPSYELPIPNHLRLGPRVALSCDEVDRVNAAAQEKHSFLSAPALCVHTAGLQGSSRHYGHTPTLTYLVAGELHSMVLCSRGCQPASALQAACSSIAHSSERCKLLIHSCCLYQDSLVGRPWPQQSLITTSLLTVACRFVSWVFFCYAFYTPTLCALARHLWQRAGRLTQLQDR
jgi:hypothetical protein